MHAHGVAARRLLTISVSRFAAAASTVCYRPRFDRPKTWVTDGILEAMVFMADGFSAWLAATMADAGRKKLTQFFSGTDEQGRALRSAASEAMQATARELRPDDPTGAEDLARVIDHLFMVPTRDDNRDANTTASLALETSIGAQLAVMDDATITGVSQSA